jgi:hypothetical protein
VFLRGLGLGGDGKAFCYDLWGCEDGALVLVGKWIGVKKREGERTYTFGKCFSLPYEHDITFDEICVQCLQCCQ